MAWKDEQIKLLREACEFYAGIAQPLNGGDDNEPCMTEYGLDNKYERGGKRAREALKKLGEMK
jgi:hypothetical protein